MRLSSLSLLVLAFLLLSTSLLAASPSASSPPPRLKPAHLHPRAPSSARHSKRMVLYIGGRNGRPGTRLSTSDDSARMRRVAEEVERVMLAMEKAMDGAGARAERKKAEEGAQGEEGRSRDFFSSTTAKAQAKGTGRMTTRTARAREGERTRTASTARCGFLVFFRRGEANLLARSSTRRTSSRSSVESAARTSSSSAARTSSSSSTSPSAPSTSSSTVAPSSSSSSSSASTTSSSPSPSSTPAAGPSSSPSSTSSSASAAQEAASSEPSAFVLPGRSLAVLPIGLGVFGGVAAVALIVVALVTFERRRYRAQFARRRAEQQRQQAYEQAQAERAMREATDGGVGASPRSGTGYAAYGAVGVYYGVAPDSPACRICLGGAEDSDELGELFTPCKCSGTTAHVHPECLAAWRRGGSGRSAATCPTCGFEYQLGMSGGRGAWGVEAMVRWPALRVLAVLVFFYAVFGLIGTHIALPLAQVGKGGADWVLRDLLFPDLYTPASVLRALHTALGILVGDCRPFVVLPPAITVLRHDPLDPFAAPQCAPTHGLPLSLCHRVWGYKSVVQRPGWVAREASATVLGMVGVVLLFFALVQIVAIYLVIEHYFMQPLPPDYLPDDIPVVPFSWREVAYLSAPIRILHGFSLIVRLSPSATLSYLAIASSFTMAITCTLCGVHNFTSLVLEVLERRLLSGLRVLPRVRDKVV
ncbi:hypothetical protein JCM10207_003245 [Rhodosporidiobolus poonsookiae]